MGGVLAYKIALSISFVDEVSCVRQVGIRHGVRHPALLLGVIDPQQTHERVDVDVGRVQAGRRPQCFLEGQHEVLELVWRQLRSQVMMGRSRLGNLGHETDGHDDGRHDDDKDDYIYVDGIKVVMTMMMVAAVVVTVMMVTTKGWTQKRRVRFMLRGGC